MYPSLAYASCTCRVASSHFAWSKTFAGSFDPERVNTPAALETWYRTLDTKLRALGLRNQIHFMGLDLVATNQQTWFDYAATHMSDILDAYSIHVFWDYWDTAKLEQRLEDVRAIVDAEPAHKPVYSMEYGVRGIKTIGTTNFVDPGVWDTTQQIPITQTNVKRLLAYSSISHVGYILLGLVAAMSGPDGNETGLKGIAFYLFVYAFMTIGAFAIIIVLRRQGLIGDELDDLNGLFQRSPASAVLLLIFMLSLAGIPPLAGFVGKYYIFLALIETGHYYLALFGALYIVPALYYYFRIVVHAWLREPAGRISRAWRRTSAVRRMAGLSPAA